jgi:hypothetical protein
MVQDIIAQFIVFFTAGYVVYSTVRSLTVKKTSQCAGCSGCSLKKIRPQSRIDGKSKTNSLNVKRWNDQKYGD